MSNQGLDPFRTQ